MNDKTDTTLTVASAIASTTYAKDYGKSAKTGDSAVNGMANCLNAAECTVPMLMTDSFREGNVIHAEVFGQIVEGYLPAKRAENAKKTGKEFVATLSDAAKKQRENDRKQGRRLTMNFLSRVAFVMEGGKASPAAENRSAKTEWHPDEKRIAALMALHDSASGTDKVPQQEYEKELQQLLKPAIDFLRSKSDVAKRVHAGYGQQYKGSFSIKKTK